MRILLLILAAVALQAAEPNLTPVQVVPTLEGGGSRTQPTSPAPSASTPAGSAPIAPPTVATSGSTPRPMTLAEVGPMAQLVGISGWVRIVDLVVYDVWNDAYAAQRFDGDFAVLATPRGSYLVSRETALIRLDAITCLDTRSLASMAIPPNKSPTYLTPGGSAGFAPQSYGVGIVTGTTRLFAGMRTVGKLSTTDAQELARAIGALGLQEELTTSVSPLETLVRARP